MPKGYPRTGCSTCGRPIAECGSLSRRGKCADCGEALRTANLVCLVTHQGPFFDHWRAAMAASVGALLLDDDHAGR